MQDFAAMAQQSAPQQAAPTEQMAQGTPEDVKQNILGFFQDVGMLPPEGAERQQLETQATELAQLMIEGNEDKIAEHPLYKILIQAMAQMQQEMEKQGQLGGTGGPVPQQAQPGQAPVKDFASMMPPSGGGLPGR